MPKPKPSTIKLQVFKGREARLNKAIFHTLVHRSPQTIYDIHKEVKKQKGLRYTHYASVNRRVRALEEFGYINGIGVKKTKVGFEAAIFEVSARAYLSMILNATDLDNLIMRADETTAITILGALVHALYLGER